jgi:protein SCO1/2
MMRFVFCLLLVLTSGTAHAFDPFAEAGIDPRPGAQIPLDLPFLDEKGASVTLRTLAGNKPIVLAPVLHRCPNICGVTLAGLAEAVRAQSFVPGNDFSVIAFGIDPKEGPAEAQASLVGLEKDLPRSPANAIHALTGEAGNIASVTQALGYRYAFDQDIGQYAHLAAIAVLTRDGRLVRWLYGLAPAPTDLKLALIEAGEGRLGNWGDQLLLLCYHYDPVTGRYGALIFQLLQLGGGLTVLLMAGLIGLALLRERHKRQGGRP